MNGVVILLSAVVGCLEKKDETVFVVGPHCGPGAIL